MFDNHAEYRKFKGGSWDLRKTERRMEQVAIGFPDRRREERRMNVRLVNRAAGSAGGVSWVAASDRDE